MTFMKKQNILVRLILLTVVILAGCSNNDGDSIVVDMLPKTRAIELTATQKAYIHNNNDFSFNLFKTINQHATDKNSNILSPISVSYVLGMLNDGSTGTTSKEITSLLGFEDCSVSELNELCKTLIEEAPETDPSITLKIANYLAVSKDAKLQKQFQKDMDHYYHAETASLDFTSPNAVNTINDWCNIQTDGAIPIIVNYLPKDTRLALLNAINFKATWTEKFDAKDTKPESFTLENGNKKELQMMHRKATALYGFNNTFAILRLPYGGGNRWSMYIILPCKGKTIDDIINSLNEDIWNKKSMTPVVVDIKVPRFNSMSDIDLIPIISKMGATSLFSEDAGLTKICENKQLFVTMMKQKAVVTVNEEGTQLIATTIASETESGIKLSDHADFHCNRPFVYLIQESSSEAIFFIGTFRGE
jgi:Serine protease inhibitor